MLSSALPIRQMELPLRLVWTTVMATACLSILNTPAVLAQPVPIEDIEAANDDIRNIDDVEPFRQTLYSGTAILIHLPTNTARAIVMPEPVTLQGDPEQMPGVQLAYEGEVIGFFATRTFTRRAVSFIGVESGVEYLLQIRASENGIVEPLKIVR